MSMFIKESEVKRFLNDRGKHVSSAFITALDGDVRGVLERSLRSTGGFKTVTEDTLWGIQQACLLSHEAHKRKRRR